MSGAGFSLRRASARLALILLLFAAAACGQVPVIVDTDLGPDCDDAGALAMLHTMATRGEATPLAIVCNTTSPWCAPAVEAIDTYYGRTRIPVGTLKGPGNPGGSADWNGESFNRYLVQHFPNRGMMNSWTPEDAVALYRRILEAQPDHSVAIVSIGNLANLRNLLDSKPGGLELVRRKVRVLSVMGGRYPRGKESNFAGDIPASKAVLERWPTPIMFSGFEVGDRIYTGQALWDKTPESNPVRMAYGSGTRNFVTAGRKTTTAAASARIPATTRRRCSTRCAACAITGPLAPAESTGCSTTARTSGRQSPAAATATSSSGWRPPRSPPLSRR